MINVCVFVLREHTPVIYGQSLPPGLFARCLDLLMRIGVKKVSL